jgi:hypothetical protein
MATGKKRCEAFTLAVSNTSVSLRKNIDHLGHEIPTYETPPRLRFSSCGWNAGFAKPEAIQ